MPATAHNLAQARAHRNHVSPRLEAMAEHALTSSELAARERRNQEATLNFLAWREEQGLPVYVNEDELVQDLEEPAPLTLFQRFAKWVRG